MVAEYILPAVMVLIGLGALTRRFAVMDLPSKFAQLGTIQGKTLSQVKAVVGEPQVISALGEGKTLLIWRAVADTGGYSIALRFSGNLCEGVVHETKIQR